MHFPHHSLNEIFKKNHPLNGILSIYGDFGVGKTILAFQIALIHAKLNEHIIYIYTKPNFPNQIIRKGLQYLDENEQLKILNNFIFLQMLDFEELMSLVYNLERLIIDSLSSEKTIIKLIVIDSITDLYRLELNKEKKEKNYHLNYQLNQLLATLRKINQDYHTEILCVNYISRKNIDNQVQEIQTGGNVMDYWISYAIKLDRTEKINERKISLTKHQQQKYIDVSTFITSQGFE